MNKRLNPRYFLAVLAILALALIGACASGSSDESSSYPGAPGNPGADYDDVVPDSGYGTEEQYTKLQSSGNDSFESGSEGSSYSGGGASATAAPAATMAASGVVTVRGDYVSTESADPTTSGNSGSASVENEIA